MIPLLDRRQLLTLLAAAGVAVPAKAQAPQQRQRPAEAAPQRGTFGYEDVIKRARELSESPFDPVVPPLPPQLENQDWDAWREIRFRPDRALLGGGPGRFRVQLFHLGHLFKKPVTINTIRDRIATPIPYQAALFDYGKTKFDKPLPVNLGFAGFRIHYPLNDPRNNDELISFVGSSYFRHLGKGQQYGLSARGLSIDTGLLNGKEEFPFFREFWIDTPDSDNKITFYALLDGPSVAGAFQFDLAPGEDSPLDIGVTLFSRKPVTRLGIAPLTSMYFLGENDRHFNDRNKLDEFRPELHDSDGLLIHTENDEWIWRPLKNPQLQEVHMFEAKNIKGFGLMQRDRRFEHYQDLELAYESRPSYWVEPREEWGEGSVELVELATKDETFDNIICAFIPKAPTEPGKPLNFGYRIYSMNDGRDLHRLAQTLNTFSAPAAALGSSEQAANHSRRFMIDFNGGDLAYYLKQPNLVELVPSATDAKVIRHFLVPHPQIRGFRAMIDVLFEENKIGNVRAYLRSGPKLLSETWNYAWRFYAATHAIGSSESIGPNARRLTVEFTGGELDHYVNHPEQVQLVPNVVDGKVLRSSVTPAPQVRGFRATLDVEFDEGKNGAVRAHLRSGPKVLSETWHYTWRLADAK